MDNKAIAAVFEEMGNILDIQGADFFRINAFKKAAITVLNFPKDLRDVVDKDPASLVKISGIGKALSDKILELVKTGKCEEHQKIKKSIPEGLLEILKLRGVGPKKVKLLYLNLAIKSIPELKDAASKGLVSTLEGMGEKSEKEILKAIDEYSNFSTDRHLIGEARIEAERYIEYLSDLKQIKKIQYAGSLRRCQETIGDIDILVTVKNPEKESADIMSHFVNYKEVINLVAKGKTKSSVVLSSGIDVDLRVVEEDSFGAALHYFTGDKQHNIRIRDLAKKKGLKVSEYGVFENEKKIAGKEECEIFEAVGLPFIIPELRRDDGEIEYGLEHKKFPKFVELKDIKGDLHSHSTYSDGERSVKEMAEQFVKKGYDYCAITDHSSAVGIVGGMDEKKIKKQWKDIDRLNENFGEDFKILKGCEVDILKNGELDFSDEILNELDLVIISAHMHGRLEENEQTKRLIKAIEHPRSMIMGHPTGRLLNKRTGMKFDMEKVIDACVENNVILEINSSPIRLDLSEKYIKTAKYKGAKFVVSTDAHGFSDMENMEFGVGMGRRGWLEAEDIINTYSFKDLTAFLKRL